MNIKVDPHRLVDTSNNITVINHTLSNIMDEIELLILSVNGSWQGDSEKAFSEKIIYVKNQFSAISSFFDDYAELLKSFSAGYEQLESELTTKINL